MDVKSALKNLRDGKKRKFSQTLDVVVNLQFFDVRKEALNTFISLPHGREKKVAAFLLKRSAVVDTITEDDFVKFKEVKDMKKLAKQYDFFMASAPMMAKVATKFGRVFGPLSKMPSPQAGIVPQESEEAVKAMREKMNAVVRVKHKEPVIKLAVGKDDMSDDQLVENVEAVIAALKEKLPRGNENIKNIAIKFTMSKPERVYEAARKSSKGAGEDSK